MYRELCAPSITFDDGAFRNVGDTRPACSSLAALRKKSSVLDDRETPPPLVLFCGDVAVTVLDVVVDTLCWLLWLAKPGGISASGVGVVDRDDSGMLGRTWAKSLVLSGRPAKARAGLRGGRASGSTNEALSSFHRDVCIACSYNICVPSRHEAAVLERSSSRLPASDLLLRPCYVRRHTVCLVIEHYAAICLLPLSSRSSSTMPDSFAFGTCSPSGARMISMWHG